ncbi:NAD(P)-dependent oxidoreductase [Enterococcus nangangensis]
MSMYQILLQDNFPKDAFATLEPNFFQLRNTAAPDAIMVASSKVPDTLLHSKLLAIARAGVGVNTINVPQATEKGTIVMNTPGVNANAVKELILLSLFLLQRPVFSAAKMVQSLTLTPEDASLQALAEARRGPFVGAELQGKTVGLLGLGAIGTQVARMCYEMGMEVLGFARRDHQLDYVKQVELLPLLQNSDFIIVVLPLTSETKNLLNSETLKAVKPGSCLLNFGRAEVVETQGVLDALAREDLRAYITDFPLPEFINHKRVMMLPHIGGSTKEALAGGADQATRALRNFLLYGSVRESINYPAMRLTFSAPYRLTIFYENERHAWEKIMGSLTPYNLQIVDTASNRKGDHSYMIIDVLDSDLAKLLAVEKQLATFSFVKQVRLLKRPY